MKISINPLHMTAMPRKLFVTTQMQTTGVHSVVVETPGTYTFALEVSGIKSFEIGSKFECYSRTPYPIAPSVSPSIHLGAPEIDVKPIISKEYFSGIPVVSEKFVDPRFYNSQFGKQYRAIDLCKEIQSADYKVIVNAGFGNITWLNTLIKVPNFYELWTDKKNSLESIIDKVKAKEVIKLEDETREYRRDDYYKLIKLQRQKIMRFNRLLLEASHPNAPKIEMETKKEKMSIRVSAPKSMDEAGIFYNRTAGPFKVTPEVLAARYKYAGELLIDAFLGNYQVGLIHAVALRHDPNILPGYLDVISPDKTFSKNDPDGNIKYCVWVTMVSDTDLSGFRGIKKQYTKKSLGLFLVRAQQIQARRSPNITILRTHSPLYIGKYIEKNKMGKLSKEDGQLYIDRGKGKGKEKLYCDHEGLNVKNGEEIEYVLKIKNYLNTKDADSVWKFHSGNGAKIIYDNDGNIMLCPNGRPDELDCAEYSISYEYDMFERFNKFWMDLLPEQRRYVKALAKEIDITLKNFKEKKVNPNILTIQNIGIKQKSPFSREKTQKIIDRLVRNNDYKIILGWETEEQLFRKGRLKVKKFHKKN